MKLGIPRLKTSTKLQLCFAAGMLVPIPVLWMVHQLPIFKDMPLWFMIGLPAGCVVAGLVWFRQCMSPDKQSFKPKWW